jgi:asparagine synthetase B (glutamine-hydrolysing)
LLLSGGFDSRLILGAMHELGVSPKIVTLEHGRQEAGMDGRFASLMAERLGLECDLRRTRRDFFSSKDSLEVFYIQDGMVPTWDAFAVEVYPELDSGMGAVWDGLILDVGLGGSSRQPIAGIRSSLKQFARSKGRQAGVPNRTLNHLLLGLILTPRRFLAANKGFMRRLRGVLAKIPPSENQVQNFLLKGRIRRRVAVNPHQLFSAKVEPVTPGTDLDFMDYAHRIPDNLKTNQKLYIEVLRRHFPILTEVPVHSGGFMFNFNTDELTRRYSIKRRIRRTRKRISKVSRFLQISLSRSMSGTPIREYPALPTGGYDSHLPPQLVIRVLEEKHFDRPFYNKRLLRRLFAAYRDGHVMYHELFTNVFYIELWYLLFVDEDSSLLFDPKNPEFFEELNNRDKS